MGDKGFAIDTNQDLGIVDEDLPGEELREDEVNREALEDLDEEEEEASDYEDDPGFAVWQNL